jgi:hypothetical protein
LVVLSLIATLLMLSVPDWLLIPVGIVAFLLFPLLAGVGFYTNETHWLSTVAGPTISVSRSESAKGPARSDRQSSRHFGCRRSLATSPGVEVGRADPNTSRSRTDSVCVPGCGR